MVRESMSIGQCPSDREGIEHEDKDAEADGELTKRGIVTLRHTRNDTLDTLDT